MLRGDIDPACQDHPTLSHEAWTETTSSRWTSPDNRAAKSVCMSCPLQIPCLENAVAMESLTKWSVGIWGGTTPRERRKLIRRAKYLRRVRVAKAAQT